MRKFKDVKDGFRVSVVVISLGWVCGLSGCMGGGSAWWDSPKLRNLEAESPAAKEGANPPVAKSPVSEQPAGGESDVQANMAERQVSSELERLKKAYERARQAEQSQAAIQPMGRVDDSDSLAAKLSQPARPYGASSGYGAEGGAVVTNQPSAEERTAGERPVIQPIQRTATITGVEAKGAGEKSESVKILNVEPMESQVAAGKPEPVLPVTVSVAGQKEEAVGVETAAVKPANQAIKLNIPDPAGAGASVEKLLQKLEQKLKERPGDTGTQVKLHLVYAMLGQWQEALKDSGGKDTTGGELAKNLAALVKVFDDGNLSSAEQANEALKLLNELQAIFRQQADLAVSNMQLCREVVSFGCYKAMPAEYFVSGKRLPVIVYLELENFTSKELKSDSYQTLLSLTMEVVDGRGKVCWQKHDDKIEDLANKRRRDFYIARLVTLPAGLPKGTLQLKVTVEDLNGNKVSQKMLAFELK